MVTYVTPEMNSSDILISAKNVYIRKNIGEDRMTLQSMPAAQPDEMLMLFSNIIGARDEYTQ